MPCEQETATSAAVTTGSTFPGLVPGVPPLNSLYLYLSGTCNLFCSHCWISPIPAGREKNDPFLKMEYVRRAIREARPLGLSSVKLTGGEPLLHPQFRELIRLIGDENIRILIETNGTLIDDDLAVFLKGIPQLSFISVSLDGVTAEAHETIRGVPGSHEKTVAGIRSLVRSGFKPQVICSLHRGNKEQMGEMVKLAVELGCGSVKFNNIQRMGRGEEFVKDMGLEVSEILDLYRYLEKEIVPFAPIRIYFDIPKAFYSIGRLLRDSSCRCSLLNILGILATGEISLCGVGVTTPELIFGHMAQDRLDAVWNRNQTLALLRRQIPTELEGVCSRCLHRDICLGNCIANNYHLAGRLNAPYAFCQQASEQGIFPLAREYKTY
jgi:SynChlorMet cassette radical SAM/SPASM protein ScmF